MTKCLDSPHKNMKLHPLFRYAMHIISDLADTDQTGCHSALSLNRNASGETKQNQAFESKDRSGA